ncbi:MAG TPA: MFS transporter, partial [Nocardioides bacterium]|nr:MFS transporter [Nocardioides sp.]
VVGVVSAAGFLVVESREREPLLALGIFRSRTFSAANGMTLLVYGALGAVSFFTTIQLQTVSGYGALAAGAAFVPMTLIMLSLGTRSGRLGVRIGPRVPMTVGPLIMAVGVLLMRRIDAEVNYVADVLPAMVVFGLGLTTMIAPLTATVLAAAPEEHAGIASGVNNAVARAGSLLAVAALPVVVGLGGAEYADPGVFDTAFNSAMAICAGLLVVGAGISWIAIRRPEVAVAAASAQTIDGTRGPD